MALLKLATGPLVEPVTIEEIKTQCRLDDVDIYSVVDDVKLPSLIKAARQYLENLCGPMITQTWEQYQDNWPGTGRLIIERPRLQEVSSLTYTDDDETETTFSSSYYTVDTVNENRPAIVLKSDYSWPTVTLFNANPIKVTFICGYGDTPEDVPEPLRQALLLLVAHWYENREPYNISISGNSVVPIPFTVDALIANHRQWI